MCPRYASQCVPRRIVSCTATAVGAEFVNVLEFHKKKYIRRAQNIFFYYNRLQFVQYLSRAFACVKSQECREAAVIHVRCVASSSKNRQSNGHAPLKPQSQSHLQPIEMVLALLLLLLSHLLSNRATNELSTVLRIVFSPDIHMFGSKVCNISQNTSHFRRPRKKSSDTCLVVVDNRQRTLCG